MYITSPVQQGIIRVTQNRDFNISTAVKMKDFFKLLLIHVLKQYTGNYYLIIVHCYPSALSVKLIVQFVINFGRYVIIIIPSHYSIISSLLCYHLAATVLRYVA